MVKTHYINFDSELTESQIKELKEAEKAPIVFDEDCPELTEDELKQFSRIQPSSGKN